MRSSDAGRFLRWFFGLLAAGLGLLFLVTALVDPRGLVANSFPGVPLLCERGIVNSERHAKRPLIAIHRPREVMLGTSRVAWGFADTDAQALLEQPAVNLGIDGGSLEEIADHFRLAAESGTVRRVWIGLDFGMFHDEGRAPERQPGLPSAASAPIYGIADPSAVRHALRGLVTGQCHRPRLDLLGFPQPGRADALAPEALDAARMASASRLTADNFRALMRAGPASRERRYRDRMSALARIAAEAGLRGIRLVLFVNPSHPSYLSALERAGAGGAYRRWQRDLDALYGRGREPALLFRDFTSLPEARVEDACESHGAAPCAFYDPVHYRPAAVGAAMLRSVLAPVSAPGLAGTR